MTTLHTDIELFHLLFLRQLEGKLDKSLYALKGGCNLRFFFKSIRYSEDIDFDVAIIAKTTLENKINKLLDSVDFRRVLQSKQIDIVQSNPVKQTETTQRWKLLLRTSHSALPVPTKIEFSRRKLDKHVLYSSVDSDVIQTHHLYQILCNHYDLNTALSQKINALIYRTETQARDIFDLKWLLDQGAIIDLKMFTQKEINSAIENAHGIHYQDFKSHVIAYLMEDYQSFYDSPKQWEKIKMSIMDVLRGKT